MITRLPLEELQDPRTGFAFQRGRFLRSDDIKSLLHTGPQRFVVANCGHELEWIEGAHCYRFFKNEVRQHLVDGTCFHLEDLPEEYAYVASLWDHPSGLEIIVLEMHH